MKSKYDRMSGENEGKSAKKWLFSFQFLVDTPLFFINGINLDALFSLPP